MDYIRLETGAQLPDINRLNPFKSVVLVEEPVTAQWQEQVSNWLVSSGCRYLMASGIDADTWDDAIDLANMRQFNYAEIPAEDQIITTWHGAENIEDVLFFAKHSAWHPEVKIENLVLLHISPQDKSDLLNTIYHNV